MKRSSRYVLAVVLVGGALAAVGFALGEKTGVGFWLIVVGANGAMISLAVLAQTNALGTSNRRKLVSCLVLFLVGFVLFVAAASILDTKLARALALTASLPTLLAFFTVLGMVSGLRRFVVVAGILLMCLGGTAAGVGWQGRHLWFASQQPMREIRLSTLLAEGPTEQRHIRLTHFRYCEPPALAEGTIAPAWYAVVPVEQQVADLDHSPSPETPTKVLALVENFLLPSTPRSRRDPKIVDSFLHIDEQKGFDGVILNGIEVLPEAIWQQVRERSPETDLSTLILIKRGPSAVSEDLWQWLGGGLGLLALGFVTLSVPLIPAWRSNTADTT
jgi:hypothetical protein